MASYNVLATFLSHLLIRGGYSVEKRESLSYSLLLSFQYILPVFTLANVNPFTS
jgi:hypothetical protein